jgi:hypothetical protein
MSCDCGKKRILKCGKCKSTFYCCQKEQKKDWPEHQKTCCPDIEFVFHKVWERLIKGEIFRKLYRPFIRWTRTEEEDTYYLSDNSEDSDKDIVTYYKEKGTISQTEDKTHLTLPQFFKFVVIYHLY